MRSAAALARVRAGRGSRRPYLRHGWSRFLITGEQDRPSRPKQEDLPGPATRIGGKARKQAIPSSIQPPSALAVAVALQPARLPSLDAALPPAAVARLAAPETPPRTAPTHL